MSDIIKGDTFADGEVVTGARLNALIDNATINECPASKLTGTIAAARIPTGLVAGTLACTTGKLLGGVSSVAAEVTPSAAFSFSGSDLDLAARGVAVAKLPQVTASRLLGRGSAAGAGDQVELAAADGVEINGTDVRLSNSVLRSMTASKILGRGSAAGAGVPVELTPSTGLTLSGTDLSVSIPLRARMSFVRGSITVTGMEASTDKLTISSDTPEVGDIFVALSAEGGLTYLNTYYVAEVVDATHIKLSETYGGAVFNLTADSAATGDHYIYSLSMTGISGIDFTFAAGASTTVLTFSAALPNARYSVVSSALSGSSPSYLASVTPTKTTADVTLAVVGDTTNLDVLIA